MVIIRHTSNTVNPVGVDCGTTGTVGPADRVPYSTRLGHAFCALLEHLDVLEDGRELLAQALAGALGFVPCGRLVRRIRSRRQEQVEQAFISITEENLADVKEYRGRGLVWGMEFHDKARAGKIAKRAFELGLLIDVRRVLPTLGANALGRGNPAGESCRLDRVDRLRHRSPAAALRHADAPPESVS